MIDPSAPTFGLPSCLRIPIAAVSVDAVRRYVGTVVQTIKGRDGRENALCVQPHELGVAKHPSVKLWKQPNADAYLERLHPRKQVWVHVDFDGYRDAYLQFGMPPIPAGYFLDHIQNREAIRLRGHTHPFLRLCPVSRRVNTSGGVNTGGEGMEKKYLKELPKLPPEVQAAAKRAMSSQVVYADPMDLTKMLDIPPGTSTLPGVRDVQGLFYP